MRAARAYFRQGLLAFLGDGRPVDGVAVDGLAAGEVTLMGDDEQTKVLGSAADDSANWRDVQEKSISKLLK